MSGSIRAAVYDEIGGPLEVRDVPAPECPPDGAVVAVSVTGVCRSDWHAWRGHDPVSLPHVPGHEFAGVVAAVGPQVQRFAVGDRVTAPFVNGCGRCAFCHAGQAQICPDQTQPGFTHPGSFADQVVVRAADLNLVSLPPGVDDLAAAALGCRFATAYRGLTARGGLQAGQRLAVVGCGGVGLSAIMIGVALGARVYGIDPSPAARDRAAEFGAQPVAYGPEVAAELRDLTGGGVDVSMDAYGSAATAETAVRSLRRGGRHVQVGLMLGFDAAAPLPWDLVVAYELSVHGSHGMAAADYPELLELITSGRLDPARLVGREITLDRAGRALAAMDSREAPAGAGTVVIRL